MKLFAAFVLLIASFSAHAQDVSTFEIGTRAVEGQRVELVFSVTGSGVIIPGETHSFGGTRFIIARAKTSMGLSTAQEPIQYYDFEFDLLTYEAFQKYSAGKAYISGTALGFKAKRDLTIDNAATSLLSLVGVSAGGDAMVSQDLKFFVEGSLDILGFGMSRRFSDGAALNGSGFGAGAEIGAEYLGKYRIVIGSEYLGISGNPQPTTGYFCNTYWAGGGNPPYPYGPYPYNGPYNGEGYYYTICGYGTQDQNMSHRDLTNSYLKLTAELSRSISVFGQVGYAVYEATDLTGSVPDSRNARWSLRLGVAAKLR